MDGYGLEVFPCTGSPLLSSTPRFDVDPVWLVFTEGVEVSPTLDELSDKVSAIFKVIDKEVYF